MMDLPAAVADTGQAVGPDQNATHMLSESLSGLQLVSVAEGDSDDEAPKPKKMSKAKMRFNKAALTVLTSVIDKRMQEDIPEEKPGEETDISDGGRRNKGQRPNASVGTPTTGARKKRGMSLASVVGVVTFRKLYMSNLQAHAEKQVAERRLSSAASMTRIDEDDTETLPLPPTPRFCAMLSPEAQFAMLKGYEDKILKDLKDSYPTEKDQMVRVKAPYGKKVQINGLIARRESKGEVANVKSSKDLELRKLTGNFETAMNIVDQLKSSRGEKVLSPRLYRTDIPPLKRYNNWAKQWARQFKADK